MRDVPTVMAIALAVILLLSLGGQASSRAQGPPVPAVSGMPSKGAPFPKQLMVFDRRGRVVWKLDAPGHYLQPTLSPDGTRIAVSKFDWDANRSHIWVFDLRNNSRIQVTSGSASEYQPLWSADGNQIAYASFRDTYGGLYRKALNGVGGEELLYRAPFHGVINLSDWSLDGRFLSYWTGGVLYVAPLDARVGSSRGHQTIRWGADGVTENESSFSPDGRFVAYRADSQGREIYVRPFDPSVTGDTDHDGAVLAQSVERWRVSRNGGEGLVFWRRDGRELYYLASDGGVMAVDVTTTPSFRAGMTRRLFQAPSTLPLLEQVPQRALGSVSRDGQRFVWAVPLPPQRKEIRLGRAALIAYVGNYTMSSGDPLMISLEGDHLVMYDGYVHRQLSAESTTTFFMKTTHGDIEFSIDGGGRVSELHWYSWFSGLATVTRAIKQ